MATTQYIGARYVPLFANPIEWDNTREYEALTIVIHEGNSFTSKQYVPKGVDINNESFWAVTGNYNAQVEQYRKEVKTFDNRITKAQEAADNANNKFPVATDDIAANAVVTAKVADASITSDKLADNAVVTAKVADASITSDKLADNAVTSDKLAANAVTSDKLAANAVVTAKVANASITSDKLADNAVVTAKIADASITSDKLAPSILKNISTSNKYENCNMIYIGDSWGQGFYQSKSHVNEGLASTIAKYLNIKNLTNVSVCGSGWVQGGDTNRNFAQQYATIDTNTKKNADIIVIAGGQNDAASSLDDVKSNCNSLFTSINKESPNADVFLLNMPFTRWRTFGVSSDTTPAIGIPNLADVYFTVQKEFYNFAQRNNRVWFCFQSARRWGFFVSEKQTDDAWHPNAAGYDTIGYVAAQAILARSERWPTINTVVSGYTGVGNVTRDSIFEDNGVVTLELAIYAKEDTPIGTYFYLPSNCMRCGSYYLSGVTTASSKIFVSFDNDFENHRVKATIQGGTLTTDDWLFLAFSWNAGY